MPGVRLSQVLALNEAKRQTSGQTSEIPRQTRQKWAAQIGDAVESLHRLGLIWGNGKLSNIIISGSGDDSAGDDGDAWLIDFGGGWTRGWVDADLADTVEGDKQSSSGGRRARQLALKGELPSTKQALHCVVSTALRAWFESDARAAHDARVRVCISSTVDLRSWIGIIEMGMKDLFSRIETVDIFCLH